MREFLSTHFSLLAELLFPERGVLFRRYERLVETDSQTHMLSSTVPDIS